MDCGDRVAYDWGADAASARSSHLKTRAKFEPLSPRSWRRTGRAGLAAAALAGLVGCSYMPGVAIPGSGSADMRGLVVNRVWQDKGADAPAGSIRIFLEDGTMAMTSCVETYRLSAWRWVEGSTLVWEEDDRTIRAEVALAGRDAMVLVIDLGDGASLSREFSAVQAPVVCPDLPR